MSTSRCNSCGEEILKSSNYSIKIHPSKRIPKKAHKLIEKRHKKLDESLCRLTKFQKYLLRRSEPKNTLEIACRNCGESSKIKMRKPKPTSSSLQSMIQRPKNTPVTGSNSKSKKKKRKSNADLNAGLTILPSFCTPSPTTPFSQQSRTNPFNQLQSKQTPLSHHSSANKKDARADLKRQHTAKEVRTMEGQASAKQRKTLFQLKSALLQTNKDSKKLPSSSLLNFMSNS